MNRLSCSTPTKLMPRPAAIHQYKHIFWLCLFSPHMHVCVPCTYIYRDNIILYLQLLFLLFICCCHFWCAVGNFATFDCACLLTTILPLVLCSLFPLFINNQKRYFCIRERIVHRCRFSTTIASFLLSLYSFCLFVHFSYS